MSGHRVDLLKALSHYVKCIAKSFNISVQYTIQYLFELHRVVLVDAGYVRAVRYFAVATLFLTMTSPKASYSPDSLARQTHGKLH
jgi:hypothetical protein